MSLRFALTLLLSAFALGGCATYTDVRQHQDLQQEARHIATVAVLPADVSIELVTFTGENEKESDKQNTIATQLDAVARKQLEAQGLKVVDFDFAKAVQEQPNLAFTLTQCKEALAKAKKTLYGDRVQEKNKGKFKETIGPAANAIAEATGADALLLIKYDGFEKSGGMIAKDIVAGALLAVLTGSMPVSAKEGSQVEVALIASDSGDVLWMNHKVLPQLNTGAEELAFKDFPKTQWRQPQPEAVAQAPATATPDGTAPAAAPADVTPVP